ncbi:hypothetical protein [Embleya sp. NPDC005971]|uniref:recombination directionality factor n=1 Tax=Embleya sp. NPDC005971 TaxID=3156724 RepID=UPI0033DDEA4D
MPILDLQQRMRQLGEIRIGHTIDTGRTRKDGKPLLRPAKLDKFRFTSPSRPLLEQVAALYGGTVQAWTPANGAAAEYEVYSTSSRLPVLVPPKNAFSQWYEQYKGARCVRRCDGATEQKTDKPCLCDMAKRDCAITTRLNVMLKDLPALGIWLLTTHGYYAAVELPAAAELLAMTNGYVPGWLGMELKKVMRDEGPAEFMVPTLDVEITPTALMSGRVPGIGPSPERAVAAGAERVAIAAAPDYAALASVAATFKEVVEVRRQAEAAGHLTKDLDERLRAIGEPLRAAPQAPAADQAETPPPQPAPELEVVDAEVVDDDPTDVWFQVMAVAGRKGWDTDRLNGEFAAAYDGLTPGSATAGQLRAFLTSLKGSK